MKRVPATPSADSPMRRLAHQSAVYVVANALVKASGLLLLPLQLDPRNLPVEHYGRLGTVAAAVGLLAPLLGLGLPQGLVKFSADAALGGRRRAVPFTAWTLAALSVAVGGLVLFAAAPWTGGFVIKGSEIGLGRGATTHLGRLLALYIAAEALGYVGFNFQQVEERAGVFGAAMVVKFGLLVGAQYWLLGRLHLGLEGVLLSFVVASGAASLLMSAALLRQAPWTFRAELVRPLLRYGLPLVVVGLALPLLYAGDRFLLQRMAPPLALSVYELGTRIAGVLNVVLVQGFQTAFTVIGLKTLSSAPGTGLHRRTFRHFCVFGGGFVLGLSLFSYDLLRLLARDAAYLDAVAYIFPLSLGLFAYGLYIIGVNPLYARGMTGRIARDVVLAAAANVALNLLLIPLLGAMGAALATVACYAGLAFAALYTAQRLEDFRFPWRALAGIVVGITALYALGGLVQNAPTAVRLAARAALMGLYPAVVLALGVYRWREVREGFGRLRRRT